MHSHLLDLGPEHNVSRGLKDTLHGTVYQLQVLMRALQQLTSHNTHFRLSSEDPTAAKFDDIIIHVAKQRFCIQAKHYRSKPQLQLSQFLATKGDFSLNMYFQAFSRMLHQHPEHELPYVILFTSASASHSTKLKNHFKTTPPPGALQQLFPHGSYQTIHPKVQDKLKWHLYLHHLALLLQDAFKQNPPTLSVANLPGDLRSFLFTKIIKKNAKRTHYVFRKSFLNATGPSSANRRKNKGVAKFFRIFSQYNPNMVLESAAIKLGDSNATTSNLDNTISLFFQKLILASNQPSSHQIEQLIVQSLQSKHRIYCVDFLYSEFHKTMLDWLKNKAGHTITAQIAARFFKQLSQSYQSLQLTSLSKLEREKLNPFIQIEHPALQPDALANFGAITLIASCCPQLTLMALHQLIERTKPYANYTDRYLIIRHDNLMKWQGKTHKKFKHHHDATLIILDFKGPLRPLQHIHNDSPSTQIIALLGLPTNDIATYPLAPLWIESGFKIKKNTLDHLLCNAQITIQGKSHVLSDISSQPNFWKRLFTHSFLLEQIITSSSNFGRDLPTLSEHQEDFFVERDILFQKSQAHKHVFQNPGNILMSAHDSEHLPAHYEATIHWEMNFASPQDFFKQFPTNSTHLRWATDAWEILGPTPSPHTDWEEKKRISFHQLLLHQSPLIVIADAGMGKSHLAKSISHHDDYPGIWRLVISLQACSTALKNNPKPTCQKHLLSFLQAIGQISTEDTHLFKDLLNLEHKVLFIFDGVDELDPHTQKTALKLMSLANKTQAIVIIFSRKHLKNVLETTFQCYAHEISPLRHTDTHFMIYRYLKYTRPPILKDSLLSFVDSIIENCHALHIHHLLQTPLHTLMLAEIASSCWQQKMPAEQIPELKNRFELFHTFIEKLLHQIHANTHPTSLKSHILHEHFYLHYSILALKIIRPELAETLANSQLINWENISCRYGLVKHHEPHLLFIHQSFFEYFIAHLVDKLLFHPFYAHITEQLLYFVLEAENTHIRTFLAHNPSQKWHQFSQNHLYGTPSPSGYIEFEEDIDTPSSPAAPLPSATGVLSQAKQALTRAPTFQSYETHTAELAPIFQLLKSDRLSLRQRKTAIILTLKYAHLTAFNWVIHHILDHYRNHEFLIFQLKYFNKKSPEQLSKFIKDFQSHLQNIHPKSGYCIAKNKTYQYCINALTQLSDQLNTITLAIEMHEHTENPIALSYFIELQAPTHFPHQALDHLFQMLHHNTSLLTNPSIQHLLKTHRSMPQLQEHLLHLIDTHRAILARNDQPWGLLSCQILAENAKWDLLNQWYNDLFYARHDLLWLERQGLQYIKTIGHLTPRLKSDILSHLKNPTNGFHAIYANKLLNQLIHDLLQKPLDPQEKYHVLDLATCILEALQTLDRKCGSMYVQIKQKTIRLLFQSICPHTNEPWFTPLFKRCMDALQSIADCKLLHFQTNKITLFEGRSGMQVTCPITFKSDTRSLFFS